MSSKFVLCDLDGTLLDLPDGLSSECRNRLNKLIDEGLKLSIATGRDLKKAKKALKGLKLHYPVILTNGALLADLQTEQFFKVTYINKPIFNSIYEWSKELDLEPIVLIFFDKIQKSILSFKGKWGEKGIKYLDLEEITPFLTHEVVSLQFHYEKKQLEPLLSKIKDSYSTQVNIIFIEDVSYHKFGIEGEWYWLEINAKEAGKNRMMEELSEKINIPIKDFVVFGDNLNDIDMMSNAGYSVAVANAHEDVKKIAKDLTLDHDKCGVVDYLEKHKSFFLKNE